MKLGARGVSILFASGDTGACGREGCGIFTQRYHADFPATSPYVTAVGGTVFAQPGVIGVEKVWSSSGGGFSDIFGIPPWQADVVAAYKADPAAALPKQSLWNATGRGFPDVAALCTNYCTVNDGTAEGLSGTSASSPVVAGTFARLNGVRLAAGRPPLGFLNPFIYKNGNSFNDVTQGKNDNAGDRAGGFTATKGWDPVSGWGTPNFPKLKAAVLAAGTSRKAVVV